MGVDVNLNGQHFQLLEGKQNGCLVAKESVERYSSKESAQEYVHACHLMHGLEAVVNAPTVKLFAFQKPLASHKVKLQTPVHNSGVFGKNKPCLDWAPNEWSP